MHVERAISDYEYLVRPVFCCVGYFSKFLCRTKTLRGMRTACIREMLPIQPRFAAGERREADVLSVFTKKGSCFDAESLVRGSIIYIGKQILIAYYIF